MARRSTFRLAACLAVAGTVPDLDAHARGTAFGRLRCTSRRTAMTPGRGFMVSIEKRRVF